VEAGFGGPPAPVGRAEPVARAPRLGADTRRAPATGTSSLSPDPTSKVNHMRSTLILTAGLLTAIAFAACGGAAATASLGATPSPPPSGQAPAGLEGRTFLSTGITGRALVAGSRVRLVFGPGTLGASAGCNSMSGGYRVLDGRLQTGQMGTTEMGCAEPLMAQDQWLAGFLPGAALVLDGDTLRLAKDGVTLILTDRVVADPDRPLIGTRWVVDGLIAGEAVSSVPAGVTAALTFSEATVDVEAGCNRGTGDVGIGATSVTFGQVMLTAMACAEPAMSVERAVTAVLSGEVAYRIVADTLTLTSGASGLVLKAMP
jgi:heat shock protein HslJ